MRKWTMGVGTALLAVGLAACGSSAEPAKDMEQVSDMTLEEVFQNSMEASGEVKSLHMDMVTNQQISMGEEGMEADMAMSSSMDMTLEPLAFYQQSETNIASEDIQNGDPLNTMEMYYTEADGLFLYEPFMAQWLQVPDEGFEGLATMADMQTADPSAQLEQLKQFQDDFTFEQTADEYILKLTASGEEFESLLQDELEQTFSQMQIDMQALLAEIDVESIEYELFIDKETFLTNRMNMVTDMSIGMDGESMNIKSDVEAEYSDYNGIDPITVPDEVKESASTDWPG